MPDEKELDFDPTDDGTKQSSGCSEEGRIRPGTYHMIRGWYNQDRGGNPLPCTRAPYEDGL